MRRNIVSRRRATMEALAVAAALGVTGLTTTAQFTDQKSVGGNGFTTGNVVLGVTPTTALFTVPALMPGDAFTAPVTVQNNGSMQLRYAVSSAATGDATAASVILYKVKSGVTNCTTAGFNVDGTAVATDKPLTDANLIGDSAQGNHAGDRTLDAGASEVLCFQIYLPLSTGNVAANGQSVESKSTTATLTFNAEQTINNP